MTLTVEFAASNKFNGSFGMLRKALMSFYDFEPEPFYGWIKRDALWSSSGVPCRGKVITGGHDKGCVSGSHQ